MRSSRLMIAVMTVVSLLVAACSSSPSADAVTTPLASSPAVTSTTAVSPGPSTAPTATQPAATPPSPSSSSVISGAFGWERLGTIEGATGMYGTFSFEGGYVAFDVLGLDSRAWFSTDGRVWESAPLGAMVRPCPGGVAELSGYPAFGATDGRHVVLVGVEYAMDVTPCGTQHAVAWVSSDGQSWQRSQGFGGSDTFSDAKSVWAVPGGWEAVVWTGSDRPTTLWRSSDGLRWQEVSVLVPAEAAFEISANLTVSDDGTRLLSLYNGAIGSEESVEGLRGGESRLRTSSDGRTWRDVDIDINAGHQDTWIHPIVPASQTGPASWLLAAHHYPELPTIWRSSDFRRWEHQPFPMPRVESLALTRYGYLATGNDLCNDTGAPCAPGEPTTQYLSVDGLNWTPFTSSVDASFLVDGPAGVLAFGSGGNDSVQVWKLKP
jgi:hypothetical protein